VPNIQIAWAIQGDQIKHIDEVENGIKCDCICPQCGDKLIARNRGKIKSSHFTHTTDTFCEGAAETAIHLAAKDIIVSSSKILTPAFDFKPDVMDEMSEKRKFDFGEVSNRRFSYEESKEETTVRNFRPDIEIIKGHIKIFIEITVTNKPKKSKIVDFQKNGGLFFEIDLEKVTKDHSKNELKNIVLFEKTNRRWLVLSKRDYLSKHQDEPLDTSKSPKPFNYNPFEFIDDLESHIEKYGKEFTEIVRHFKSDLNELKKATNKEWRKRRVSNLAKKHIREILRIEKRKAINDQFFAPRISNIWALNVHSHIWQYELVSKFIVNQKFRREIRFYDVVKWLRKKYSLVPFLERLNNWDLYSNSLTEKQRYLMKAIYKKKTKEIPKLPGYETITWNYLDELNKRGMIHEKEIGRYLFD
jgi:hypothetical protein